MRKEMLQKVPTKGFLRKSTNLKFSVIIKTMDTNTELSNRRLVDTSDLVGRFFDQFNHIYKRFDDIDAQFGRVSERFSFVDKDFAEVYKRFDKLEGMITKLLPKESK